MRKFLVGLALGSCALFLSCGDDSEPVSSADRALPTDPTPANFSEWQGRWDGERWNVALRKLDAHEQDLRVSFARSFARVAESHGASSTDAMGIMGSVQRLPSLSFGPTSSRKTRASFGVGGATSKGAPCDFRSCPNFAFLRLRYERFPWQRLFGSALIEALDLSNSKRRGTFQLMWDTLSGMDEVWFAEPDLAAPSADLPQSNKAPPTIRPILNAATPEGEPLEHIKTTRVREAEVYEKQKQYTLRDVVVAVLDTGVDRAHPRLKDKMFKLPLAKVGETPRTRDPLGHGLFTVTPTALTPRGSPGNPKRCKRLRPVQRTLAARARHVRRERRVPAPPACTERTWPVSSPAAEGRDEGSGLNVRGVCRNLQNPRAARSRHGARRGSPTTAPSVKRRRSVPCSSSTTSRKTMGSCTSTCST